VRNILIIILIFTVYATSTAIRRSIKIAAPPEQLEGFVLPEGYQRIESMPYVVDRSGDTLLIEKTVKIQYSYQHLTKAQKRKLCQDIKTLKSAK
jgi:biopolymer transport protein ExbD